MQTSCNPKQFLQAFDTLAPSPIEGTLAFTLDGLSIPTFFTGDLNACLNQHNMLVCTYMDFVYCAPENRFIAKDAGIYKAHPLGPEEFLSGGKIHLYRFAFREESGFLHLRQTQLPLLRAASYLPEQGELHFADKDSLRFVKEQDTLNINLERKSNECAQLEQWVRSLTQ